MNSKVRGVLYLVPAVQKEAVTVIKIKSSLISRGTGPCTPVGHVLFKMLGRERLARVIGGVLILLTITLQSASENSNDLANASLEELMNIQVYTASRYYQNSAEAPSSVTVVTAEEIQTHGYRTLAEILRNVRGFYVTGDRNYSFLGVRGFERPGDWSSRILLLVDGHRINNNITGQAMLGTEFPVDVDLIERVEIVRGPSSSIYGNNAFFAVINVITRRPPQLKGFEFSFEPGSFDTYKGRASFGGRYRGADVLFSGTFYDSAGQTLFYPEFNSPRTNYGITHNTDDEVHPSFLTTLSFRGFTLQGLFSAREKGNPTAYFGTVFNDPRTRNYDDAQYVDLAYQHQLGTKWELNARTSFDQYRLESPLAMAAPDGSAVVDKFSARGNWWASELNFSRTLGQKHKLTLGTKVDDNLRQDQGDYDAVANRFILRHQTSWDWGAYAQDEFSITRRIILNAGLRYDRYSTFGGTANPRLGLIYRALEHTNFKILYGTAFRAPDVFENYPNYANFYADNQALRPEKIRSVEGVVEQGFGLRFKLTGSLYQNQIEDLISLMPDSATGGFIYQNYGQALARGLEIGFEGLLPHSIRARASSTYVGADDNTSDGLVLPNSPRHMAKFGLTAPFFQKRLFAGLDGQYVGRRATLAENTVGGYQLFNLTLVGHALDKHLDLSGSTYNLFDRRYYDPGRPEDVQDAIQQDGRSFRVKLTWKLGE